MMVVIDGRVAVAHASVVVAIAIALVSLTRAGKGPRVDVSRQEGVQAAVQVDELEVLSVTRSRIHPW